MTEYRNKKTGAIIQISGILTSDIWEKVEKPSPISEVEKVKKAPVKKAPVKKSKA